jgi:hypothetical protein
MPRYAHVTAIAAMSLLLSLAAFAGDAGFEGDDDHDDGAPFFGEVKDVNGLKPLDGVRVTGIVAGAIAPIVVSTNEEGKFKFRGFGKDVKQDSVQITCGKDGYTVLDVSRRQLSKAPDAPVEIECLLERRRVD